MHAVVFQQILRDAAVANAIAPVVRKYAITEVEISKILLQLKIPRPAHIARIAAI